MSVRGCVIMSPEDAESYITYMYRENLPVAVIQKYPFIRVQTIKDIYDHCLPQLKYIKRYVSEDRRAYMVELMGLNYIGLNMVSVEEYPYHWLKRSDDFEMELAYINGDAE